MRDEERETRGEGGLRGEDRGSRSGITLALLAAIAGGLLAAPASAATHPLVVRFVQPDPTHVLGYRVHLGRAAGVYQRTVDVGRPAAVGGVFAAVVDVTDAERFVVVTAYGAGGESAPSNEGTLAPASSGPVAGDPTAARVFVAFDYGGLAFLYGFGLDGALDGLALLAGPPFAAGGRMPVPVWCELDGTAPRELVLGFEGDGPAEIEVRAVVGSTYQPVARFAAGATGSTRPACGDVDGDGRDEIVVGFGPGTPDQVRVFDDAAHGYAPLATPEGSGWLSVGAPGLGDGSTSPALGDFDGDGRAEIAVGFGLGSAGRVRVLDDAAHGFAPGLPGAPEGWLQLGWSAYEGIDGRVFPAAGDVDGDGRDELVLGLGALARGWARVLDDARSGFAPVPTPVGNGWVGIPGAPVTGDATPVVADLDGDGAGEVLEDLGPETSGSWARFDDARAPVPLAFRAVDRLPASSLGRARLAR